MNDVFEECYTPDLGGFLAAVAARGDRAPETMTSARQFHRERAAVTAAYEPYRLGKGKVGGGRFAKKGTLGIDILRKLLKGDGKARTETHKTFTRLHSDRKSSFGKGPITPDNLNKWATKAFGPRPTSGADMNAWDAGKRELGTWTAKLPAQARQAAWAGNLVDDKPRVPAKPDTPDVTDRDMEPVVALLTPQLNVAKQDEDRLKGRGRDAAEATAKRVAIEDAIEELYNHEETGSGTPKTRALIESLQADLVTTKDGDPKAIAALDKQYTDVLAKLPTDTPNTPEAPVTQDLPATPETPVTQNMPGVVADPVNFDGMETAVPNHIRDKVTAGAGTKESPFVTDDMDAAVFLLSEDQHVRLQSERQVSTLLDELKQEVDKMKAAGEDAKPFDLCKVTVTGTNLFCWESKGIARIEMPQLGGKPIAGSKADALPKNEDGAVDLSASFIEHLRSRGVGVKENEVVPADVLKASQNELNGTKVVGMMAALEDGTLPPGAIFVSRDDYVVDGHHRWAANVGAEYTTGEEMMMPVHVIDADILEVLGMANAYAADMGIPQAGVGQMKTGAPDTPNVDVPTVDAPDAPVTQDLPEQPDASVAGRSVHADGTVWETVDNYGMKYAAENVDNPNVAAARANESAWEDVPLTTINLDGTGPVLNANEAEVKVSTIERVKDTGLRPGYNPKVIITPDGEHHIVDGHHRVAIHSAMGKPMETQVIDMREDPNVFNPDAPSAQDMPKPLSEAEERAALIERHGEDYVRRAEVAAQELILKVERLDVPVTRDLTSIAASLQVTMVSLGTRKKTEGSLTRKIADKAAAKGLTQEEYASQIADALRYTASSPADRHADDVASFVSKLREAGYTINDDEIENYWAGDVDDYNGINATFYVTDPDGGVMPVELQFHTPETLAAKDEAHGWYELGRVSSDPAVKLQAFNESSRIFEQVTKPDGIESVGVPAAHSAPAAPDVPVESRTVADLLGGVTTPESIRAVLKRSDLTSSQRVELHRLLDGLTPDTPVTAALRVAAKSAERRDAKRRTDALTLARRITKPDDSLV